MNKIVFNKVLVVMSAAPNRIVESFFRSQLNDSLEYIESSTCLASTSEELQLITIMLTCTI